ncbi:unnamed protein product [Phaedon cochleariae]|uniref:Ankyrin repeat protein n=1 Tax=Phaedon cochleariae TaxID=80249 RepID=A0A9N9SF13_PHACE|nr:unnamed protein product [Phaedon cochleariae]
MDKKTYPLHKVVQYRNINKIRILFPETKDINEKDDKGQTVLLVASEYEIPNDAIMELLLSHEKIDPKLTNQDSFNVLHMLGFKGNLIWIKKVLEKFPDLNVDAVTDKGNTPLILATKMNHLEIIQYLHSKGASINHKDDYGFTPLMKAASWGFTEVCEILLDHDADTGLTNKRGQTALSQSIRRNNIDTVKVLLEHGSDPNKVISYSGKVFTPLSSACLSKNADVMKLLIEYGADVNFPKPHSLALFTCVKSGFVAGVEVLLKAGVNVHAKTHNGGTALNSARRYHHNEIVQLLMNHH